MKEILEDDGSVLGHGVQLVLEAAAEAVQRRVVDGAEVDGGPLRHLASTRSHVSSYSTLTSMEVTCFNFCNAWLVRKYPQMILKVLSCSSGFLLNGIERVLFCT